MPRTRTNLPAAVVLAAAAATGLAGCAGEPAANDGSAALPAKAVTASSTGSNVGLSGPQLLAAFKKAAAAGTAVHVVGAFDESGSKYALDMNLNKNGTTAGSISQSGAAMPIRVVDKVTYIQLTPSFLKLEAQSDPSITSSEIALVENKWISSQSSMGQQFASSLGGLTTYDDFINTLEQGGGSASASASPSGTGSGSPNSTSSPAVKLSDLTAAGTTTYNGRTVAVYKSPNGSTAFFDADGPAYLEKVTSKGAEPGMVTFTWNHPVTVVAPQSSEIFSG